MKTYDRFIILASLGLTIGCSAPTRDIATVAANDTREIAATEHKLITDFCIPRYKSAMDMQDIQEVDRKCLPAEVAYMTTKVAWETMLAVIQASKAGRATDADVRSAAEKLGKSLASLRMIVEEME